MKKSPMRKLVLIAAIALVTGISTSRPSPADPPDEPVQCLLCGLHDTTCYVRRWGDCEGPDGFPECTPEQYRQCLGG
jgi:hypothetical protein